MASERSRRPGYAGTMRNCRTLLRGVCAGGFRGEMDVSGKRQKHESLFFCDRPGTFTLQVHLFARRPFDTELAIYAHECAFEYFGGKPKRSFMTRTGC